MATLKNTTINSTGALQLPTGTNIQRPISPANGEMRYNTTFGGLEFYDGTSWRYFPDIIRGGLIMHVDFGDPASYPGTGSTVTDLTGNGYDGTVGGTTKYVSTNGGRWTQTGNDATNYLQLSHAALQTLGGSWTIEMVIQPSNTAEVRYFCSMANSSSDNVFLMQKNTTGTLGVYTGTVDTAYTNDEIMQLTIVRDNDDIGMIYKNGGVPSVSEQITDISTVTGWVMDQEQDSVLGGFSATQNFIGSIYAVRLYNRALGQDEILSNYNAIKTRFGI
jgi:hypothetical protein